MLCRPRRRQGYAPGSLSRYASVMHCDAIERLESSACAITAGLCRSMHSVRRRWEC